VGKGYTQTELDDAHTGIVWHNGGTGGYRSLLGFTADGRRAVVILSIRYSAAAGNNDFEFFARFEALSKRTRQLPPSTSIVAFRQPQFPLRGVVDEDFVGRARYCSCAHMDVRYMRAQRCGRAEI
jgi:hypothetical protein